MSDPKENLLKIETLNNNEIHFCMSATEIEFI